MQIKYFNHKMCITGPITLLLYMLCFAFVEPISQKSETLSHGHIPVLMFHRLVKKEAKNIYEINIDEFKEIMKLLKKNNFFPVSINEILTRKFPHECNGKKLFSITFDDAHMSQIKFMENGELDPECAVAILLNYFENPGATFFINTKNGCAPFCFESEKKIKFLIDVGMLLGNHTASHKRLDKLPNSKIIQEIGDVFLFLESCGYNFMEMVLSYPYGMALDQKNQEILKSFTYKGKTYHIPAAFSARLGYYEKRPIGETEATFPLLCPVGGTNEFEKRKHNLPRINIHNVSDLKKDILENKNIYTYFAINNGFEF